MTDWTTFASRKIEPHEFPLRRAARFFRDGGICERYERRGDHLVQFHDILNLLPDKVLGLSQDAIIRSFLFSAKNHWFGRHGRRQTIEQLIDLDDFSNAPPSMYSLRPSYIRVVTYPRGMRARRSVWAQWLQAQGWPVPAELARSIVIDAKPVEPSPGRQTALLAPSTNLLPNKRGRNPEKRLKIEARMCEMDRAKLKAMKQEAMAATFGAARSTCEIARKNVLSKIVEK